MILPDDDYAALVKISNLKMGELRSQAYRFCEGTAQQQRQRYTRGDLVGILFEQYLKTKYPLEHQPTPGQPVFKPGEPVTATKSFFRPVASSRFCLDEDEKEEWVQEDYRGHLTSRIVPAKRVVVFVHEDGREESAENFRRFRKA